MMPSITPIFSGGTGRSGTTIVVNLLARHSQVHSSMPREVRYLCANRGLLDLNFIRKYPVKIPPNSMSHRLIDRLTTIGIISPIAVFTKQMSTAWWSETGKNGNPRGLVQGMEFDELNQVLQEFSPAYRKDKYAASRNLYIQIAKAQKFAEGTKFFADSTPVNIMNAEYINQLFPESRFINMVRDGRDVAASVVREPWGPKDHISALEWWKNRMLVGFNALKSVPDDHQVTIRIVDLVTEKRQENYNALLSFLKIENEIEMEKYFKENLIAEKMKIGSWVSEVSDVKAFQSEYEKLCLELEAAGVPIP